MGKGHYAQIAISATRPRIDGSFEMAEGKSQESYELTCRAKRVSSGELPHASEHLGEATHAEGHAYNDIRGGNIPNICVVERENERRRRK